MGAMDDDLARQVDVYNRLGKTESAFSGINSAGDVRERYGIKTSPDMYAPLFRMLAANRGRRMQGAAMRAGRSASPEMSFSDIEGDYETSLNDLLGKQASYDQDQQRFVANMLHSGFGARDQFGLSKLGSMGNMASGIFGNRLEKEKFDYATQPAGLGDILGSILGIAAPIVGARVGRPENTFNFGK